MTWGIDSNMRDEANEVLADETSTDPVVRRIMRRRALLEAAEQLDRESRFEIAHPSAHLDRRSPATIDHDGRPSVG